MRKTEHKKPSNMSVRAEPIKLQAQAELGQGFRIIARNCLTQVRENQFGVERGGDPESVHQMRVGVRRLRSALRLFERWIPTPEQQLGELDWLADQLGGARDADVLASIVLPQVMRASQDQAQMLPLMQVALTIADAQRKGAARAVSSRRCSELMLALSEWLDQLGEAEPSGVKTPKVLKTALKPRATKILTRRHRKLRKLGQRLAHCSADERHHVRILAKRQRYAIEFFQSMYSDKAAQRYCDALILLQDALGSLNDVVVADKLLRRIAQSHPDLAAESEFSRGVLWAGVSQNQCELVKRWKRFNEVKTSFWT